MLDTIESAFCESSEQFVHHVLRDLDAASLDSVPPLGALRPRPLEPVLVNDLASPSSSELRSLELAYSGEDGVAYFIGLSDSGATPGAAHPALRFVRHLPAAFEVDFPLEHPLETHPQTLARFGGDGTVKVYDLRMTTQGYREQGETSEHFALHSDGLGSGGVIQTVLLYAESSPLWGGFTHFLSISRLALEVARLNARAFRALFVPDALTVTRPRGKGAIRVRGPVLYLNERGQPQSFLRLPSGEYRVEWRSDLPDLDRAREILLPFTEPFSAGSSFLNFTERGHGCLIRNRDIAHGRTSFVDGLERQRVLARKWFVRDQRFVQYRHVPGLSIQESLARLLPDQFGEAVLQGEWNLDPTTGLNRRRG